MGAQTRPKTPSHKCGPPEGEAEGDPEDPADVVAEIRSSLLCATWSGALARLKAEVNDATYKTHLRHLKLAELDEAAGTARVEAPNEFTREWVGRRHLAAVEAALSAQAGAPVSVRLVVAPRQQGLQGQPGEAQDARA